MAATMVLSDAIQFKDEVTDAINETNFNFVNSLLSHFPIEDGLPVYSDVQEFVQNWLDAEDAEKEESVYIHMQGVYPSDNDYDKVLTKANGILHEGLNKICGDLLSDVPIPLQPNFAWSIELGYESDSRVFRWHSKDR